VTYGMAYASTGDDLMDESLFVWGGATPGAFFRRRRDLSLDPNRRRGFGLARVRRKGLRVVPLGDAKDRLSMRRGELTGTGDGRLFGFFATRPARLAEIDPASGAVRAEKVLRGIDVGRAWAFSFWGGDFYFYTARPGRRSVVTRMSGTDGSLEQVVDDVGFIIVGAGVSTCAPLTSREPLEGPTATRAP
jgi:hypothetical protein